uniref:Uncharacterized protein n=1 Tax=Romanomermis culicivorax TaxID=13658 RepID=A0A915KPX4_ROMCU
MTEERNWEEVYIFPVLTKKILKSDILKKFGSIQKIAPSDPDPKNCNRQIRVRKTCFIGSISTKFQCRTRIQKIAVIGFGSNPENLFHRIRIQKSAVTGSGSDPENLFYRIRIHKISVIGRGYRKLRSSDLDRISVPSHPRENRLTFPGSFSNAIKRPFCTRLGNVGAKTETDEGIGRALKSFTQSFTQQILWVWWGYRKLGEGMTKDLPIIWLTKECLFFKKLFNENEKFLTMLKKTKFQLTNLIAASLLANSCSRLSFKSWKQVDSRCVAKYRFSNVAMTSS